jgi:DNA-binding transcriptional ArsR family regulator
MNDAVFVALADPTRRRLLERLATGPTSATGLAERFPLTRQAVVKHLGALADAGMVAKHRHGREVRYRLESAPLGEASAWLTTLTARWEQRLLQLKRFVEEQE